jgi:hypothetical protein
MDVFVDQGKSTEVTLHSSLRGNRPLTITFLVASVKRVEARANPTKKKKHPS